ncbi:MAG: glycosyltransferase family 39 protein [bacterium]
MHLFIAIIAIASAVIVGFYGILSSGFLCDDYIFLYYIKKIGFLKLALGGVYFRPLNIVVSESDLLLYGNNATGFHITNLIWHFLASIGVGVLAEKILSKPYALLIAGLVFALHPAHTESVSWIAGRTDVICVALLVWSFALWLISKNPESANRRLFRTLSWILFGLACLTKEQAYIFPLTIFLYAIFPFEKSGNGKPIKTGMIETVPFFIVAILLFIVRTIAIKGLGGYIPEESSVNFFGKALYYIFIQPFLVLFLSVNRSLIESAGAISITVIYSVLLSPLIFIFKARWRILAFCAIAIIINMLPSGHMGITPGASQNTRFLFTSSVFFSIFIAELLCCDCKGILKKLNGIIVVIYIFTSLICLQQNNYPWREAGLIVRSIGESTDRLVTAHEDEWGNSVKNLLAFNVPTDFIGAWIFRNGFREFLRLRYPDELWDIDIDFVTGGIQTEENAKRMDTIPKKGVVWVYEDELRVFRELDGS